MIKRKNLNLSYNKRTKIKCSKNATIIENKIIQLMKHHLPYIFRLVLYATLLLIWSSPVLAQKATTDFQITHYGVEHGLSQGSIYFMHKDSRGFMWFGAYEGLNRFDGHQFQRFYPNDNDSTAMRGSTVLGISEDALGNLWVGTEECLNRYDRRSGKFSSIYSKDSNRENTFSQTHPFYADSTSVWYVNTSEGILRYNFLIGQKVILDSTVRYKIDYFFNFKVVFKGKEDLWISQPKGLVRYNVQTGEHRYYFSDHPQNRLGKSSEVFTYFVDNQVVWIGLKDGLVRLDWTKEKYEIIPSSIDFSKSILYNIQVDALGRVWLGTGDDGVLFFDPLSKTFSKLAILLGQRHRYDNVQIAALYYEATENVLWINTEPNGLDKLSLDVNRIKSHHHDPLDKQGLNASVVRCFTEDKHGRIWIGVWNGGVNVFDPTNNTFSHHLSDKNNAATLPNNTVLGICTDPKGRIWAATENGLGCYEETAKGKGQWRRYLNKSNPLQSLNANLCMEVIALPDGTIVTGTSAGVYALNPQTSIFTPIHGKGDEKSSVNNILYDAKRGWIFCTDFSKGIIAFARKGQQWEKVFDALYGVNTTGFYQANNSDTLWLATNRGFICFDLNTKAYRIFTVADDMPSNCTYGILPDKSGHLWLSTNRGLARFDPVKKTFETYNPADGCQGYEYNINAYYGAASGELFFGGVNGFDHFHPEKLKRQHKDFPLYLTDFQVNNKSFSLDTVIGEAKTIRLKHFENTFSIGFTALDWQNEGTVTYRYRLVNFDKDWVEPPNGVSIARYANVPHGSYQFIVEAADKIGVWSQQSASILVFIVPAWWQTAWFKVLTALACLTGFYFLLNFYFKTRFRLRFAQIEKERSIAQLRNEIAQDIHDEIGIGLTKISLASQLAAHSLNTSKMMQDKLAALGKEARNLAAQTREIIFAVNPDFDQFSEMQAYFKDFAHIFWAETAIECHFDFPEHPSDPSVSPDKKRQLLLIFKETQNNIAKHADATKVYLTLKITKKNHYLMEIYDNGKGFAPLSMEAQNGFSKGLSGMQKRADMINALFSIESKEGQGAKIKVEGLI